MTGEIQLDGYLGNHPFFRSILAALASPERAAADAPFMPLIQLNLTIVGMQAPSDLILPH